MSFRKYFLLGEFVYNLKKDVFRLLDKTGLPTNKNLLEAKELLINISKLVSDGSENYDQFFTMFEKACQLYCTALEEFRYNSNMDYDEDEEDSDMDY